MLTATMKRVEERSGFVSMTQNFFTEDTPGGTSHWYVFGSATLFAMILQIVTGIFLTFFYLARSHCATAPFQALGERCANLPHEKADALMVRSQSA